MLLGTLREEGLLDDTVILFCGDHGDMLGDFGLWAKRLFYEGSARVPMILVGAAGDARVPAGQVDERLVGLQDVMPTLLSLAGLPVPATVEGLPMTGERRRDILYGECKEDRLATRMAHDGRHKLIWYPAGNVVQLFDLQADPRECRDLSEAAQYALIRQRLEQALVERAWGVDRDWISAGRLTGFPARRAAARGPPVRRPARPALSATAPERSHPDGGIAGLRRAPATTTTRETAS